MSIVLSDPKKVSAGQLLWYKNGDSFNSTKGGTLYNYSGPIANVFCHTNLQWEFVAETKEQAELHNWKLYIPFEPTYNGFDM